MMSEKPSLEPTTDWTVGDRLKLQEASLVEFTSNFCLEIGLARLQAFRLCPNHQCFGPFGILLAARGVA